jgi:hypothetical protein
MRNSFERVAAGCYPGPITELQVSLFEPMIEEVSRRTAIKVLDELRRNPIARPKWTDTEGAAHYLDLTVTALRQRKQSGQIPDDCYTKLGTSVRWDLDALDRWMESQKEVS